MTEQREWTKVTDDQIDEAAKIVADWICYKWDGLSNRDISAEYPDWTHAGGKMQGGKPAIRKLVRRIFSAIVPAEPPVVQHRYDPFAGKMRYYGSSAPNGWLGGEKIEEPIGHATPDFIADFFDKEADARDQLPEHFDTDLTDYMREAARLLRTNLRAQPALAASELMDGSRSLPFERDELGRMVREAWVRWAKTQNNPKPSWLLPYEDLSEEDKEADRQIGEAVARWTLIGDASRATPPTADLQAEVERLTQLLSESEFRNTGYKTLIARREKTIAAARAALGETP